MTLPSGFRMADLGLTLETLRNGDRGPWFKLDADRVTIRATEGDYDGHLFSDIVTPPKLVKKKIPVRVAMNGNAPLAIELDPATLVARAQYASGRPITAQIDWTLSLVPPASSGTPGAGKTLSFYSTNSKFERNLPPGRYVVTATLAGQTQRRDVDLWFGESNDNTLFTFKMEPRNGTLALQVRYPDGLSDSQITAAVVFGLAPLDPAGPEIPAASGTRQRVPEGRYRVTPRLISTDSAEPKNLPVIEPRSLPTRPQKSPPPCRWRSCTWNWRTRTKLRSATRTRASTSRGNTRAAPRTRKRPISGLVSFRFSVRAAIASESPRGAEKRRRR